MGCGGSTAASTDKLTYLITPNKAHILFIVGGPGSGKGTQCENIQKKIACEHISTGGVLREVVEKKEHEKWEELDNTMKAGGLVSSELLLTFVGAKLDELKGKLVLLDGFPRSQENMDEWNKQELSTKHDLIGTLYFECPEEEMKKRLLGRNEGRADDNEETIKKRIETFNETTVPVINSLDNVIKIDASKSKEEIFEEVLKKLDEKGIR